MSERTWGRSGMPTSPARRAASFDDLEQPGDPHAGPHPVGYPDGERPQVWFLLPVHHGTGKSGRPDPPKRNTTHFMEAIMLAILAFVLMVIAAILELVNKHTNDVNWLLIVAVGLLAAECAWGWNRGGRYGSRV